MICFFVTEPYRYTLDEYLRAWARSLGNRSVVVTYESLATRRSLTARTFVFTDLERLTPAQCAAADHLAQRIEWCGGRVLNRPGRALRRFELLRVLHDAGRNPFNAHRVDGSPIRCRFPAFVRDENQHTGALTPLLHDERELTAALAQLRAGAAREANLLVVEYCETRGPGGFYRKYAAMRVGERFVPRHVLFSGDWVDKTPDVVTDASLAEERAFLATFPHAADVRAVFELAGIDYGRIDYSVAAEGRVVTWEINTNPVIVPLPEKCDLRRLEEQGRSARQISDALGATDGPDVTVSLAKLPPVIPDSRGSLSRAALESSAVVWRVLARLPVAAQAVRALRRSLDLAAQRA